MGGVKKDVNGMERMDGSRYFYYDRDIILMESSFQTNI